MKILMHNDKNIGLPSVVFDILVWVSLAIFTLLSWWLSLGLNHASEWFSRDVISATILVVTFIKIRLVIIHFMEIKHAPLALRLVFEGWCVGVCALLVFLLVL